jgi:hypothetical protein
MTGNVSDCGSQHPGVTRERHFFLSECNQFVLTEAAIPASSLPFDCVRLIHSNSISTISQAYKNGAVETLSCDDL